MRTGIALVVLGTVACLGFSPAAPAQRQFEDWMTKRYLPVDTDSPFAMATGDVDGDGDLDLVVGNATSFGGQQNQLYLNEGNGRFMDATAARMPPDTDSTLSVVLGDVDGDGDLDLVVGNAGSGGQRQNRLYLNDGTGTFTDVTAARMPPDTDVTTALALGDVDRDGDLDLVVGNGSRTPNRLYLNAGGTFTHAVGAMPQNATSTAAVALGDVDGDDDLDVVVGNGGSSFSDRQNRLYLNDGNGNFIDATSGRIPSGLQLTSAVALSDVDGDDDLDIVVGNGNYLNSPQRTRLQLNDGTGTFTDVTAQRLPGVADQTEAMAVGDVDGDGDPDIALGNAAEQNRLLVNTGTGTFLEGTADLMPKGEDNTFAMAMGDVNGDGAPELVFGNIGEQNRLYLNDGQGAFANGNAGRVPTQYVYTNAVVLGDVDGDGDPDLIFGNERSPSPTQLLLNDGTGSYRDVTAVRMPPGRGFPTSLTLGDVDGDGDLDLAVGTNGQSQLLRNDGTGTFTDVTATNMPLRNDRTQAIVMGDVDGDGDLDMVLGNGEVVPQVNRLYENDGTGVFTEVTKRLPATTGTQTQSLALGDVDGDGDLDLVIGNQSQQDLLYLNDGSGRFVDATAGRMPVAFGTTYSTVLGDVDGDRDLDLAIGVNGQNLLYLNDGTGTFTDVTATRMPVALDATFDLAMADVDGDGDLDMAIGNCCQPNLLYLNDGTGSFADVTAERFPVDPDRTESVVFGDVDGDDDLDVVFGNSLHNRVYTNLHHQLTAPVYPSLGDTYDVELHAKPGYATTAHVATPILGLSLLPAPIPLQPLGTLFVLPVPVRLPPQQIPPATGVTVQQLSIPASSSLLGIELFLQGLIEFEGAPRSAQLTGYTADAIRR